MLFHSCYRVCLKILFCFQQKAAYEMRISDWSSDVCSSDLPVDPVGRETDRMDPRQFLDEFADPLAHCPMPPVSPCGSQRQVRRRMRAAAAIALLRSAERRVGKECVCARRFSWSLCHSKKKNIPNMTRTDKTQIISRS